MTLGINFYIGVWIRIHVKPILLFRNVNCSGLFRSRLEGHCKIAVALHMRFGPARARARVHARKRLRLLELVSKGLELGSRALSLGSKGLEFQ